MNLVFVLVQLRILTTAEFLGYDEHVGAFLYILRKKHLEKFVRMLISMKLLLIYRIS